MGPSVDARFSQHYEKRGLTPGDGRQLLTMTWESGKIACARLERGRYRVGQLLEWAGVPVRVIDPCPEMYNGVLVVRVEGWWALPLCGWYWVRRCVLAPVSRLLWRTAWAWGMIDYPGAGFVTVWEQFRPYRWAKRLLKRRGE